MCTCRQVLTDSIYDGKVIIRKVTFKQETYSALSRYNSGHVAQFKMFLLFTRKPN